MRHFISLYIALLTATVSYPVYADHIQNAAERQAHVVQRAILRISSEDDLDMVEVLGALHTDAARKAMVNLAYYNLGEAVMDALEWQVREQHEKILPFIAAALRGQGECDPYFIHMQEPVVCVPTKDAEKVLKRWQEEITQSLTRRSSGTPPLRGSAP